jgi:hypothetical protein
MRWVAACTVLLALVACQRDRLSNKGCQADPDCGSPASAFRCEPTTGACFCRTNGACPGAQFCNGAGFCQDRAGCERNADCLDPTLYCDTGSGQCVPTGRCATDLQCALGTVCEQTRPVRARLPQPRRLRG